MSRSRLVLLALPILALCASIAATGAGAAEVAYIDGGQVWVSTLDGASKRSLSGPSPDAKAWTETAQADGGTIIGVRRESDKMGTLNATRLWNPDGSVAGEGSLTAKPGRTSYAYPVTLDLTPDGKVVTYGYANWSGFGLGTTYEFGTYVEGSTNWYVEPFDVRAVKSATLVGRRLVGISGSTVGVQDATGQPPYSEEFTPWFQVPEVNRVDVSASGTIAAVEIWEGSSRTVAMVPFGGLGGPPPTNGSDCMLPVQGPAHNVSISPDGTSMAWQDDRGVVVAGTPVWFATAEVSTCNLSRPPVVISATGQMPSIGDSTAAVASTGGGTSGGGTPPSTAPTEKKGSGGAGGKGGGAVPTVGALPKTVKAVVLVGGLPLVVKVAKAGKVTASGKVGAQVVATGEAKAKGPGKVTVRLKATKAWGRRLGKLVGKSLKIKVTAPGGIVNLTRKLG
ncbi:MAG: hypothetical protein JST08_04465 [Actinobacteria bacterium]|nr:hypothetical protein [Actinomycetota bacterium]